MQHRICIGGPLDGIVTNYKGLVLESYLPRAHEQLRDWFPDEVPSATVVMKTSYTIKVILVDYGSLQLRGEAWVWIHNRNTPLQLLMATLASAIKELNVQP